MSTLLELLPFADMSRLELGFWSFPVLLMLVFLRVPIGLAMCCVALAAGTLP